MSESHEPLPAELDADLPDLRRLRIAVWTLVVVCLGLAVLAWQAWPADVSRWPLLPAVLFPWTAVIGLGFGHRFHQRGLTTLRRQGVGLRLLSDNLPDTYLFEFRRAADGRPVFDYLSAGFERLHDVPRELVLQDATLAFARMPPEFLAVYLAAEDRSAADLSDFDLDIPDIRPDGTQRLMHIHSRPRRRPSGELVWDGLATDVTELRARARAEHQALDRQRAQTDALSLLTRLCAQRPDDVDTLLRRIVRLTAETLGVQRASLWLSDASTTSATCRILWDAALERFESGARIEGPALRAYADIVHEGVVLAITDPATDPHVGLWGEARLRMPGATALLDAPVFRTEGATGVTGVLAATHAGTPRTWHADERTFILAIANLVALVLAGEARAAVEAKLRQAQKLEAIGQLAGGVAHDFNNILATITLQTESLLTAEDLDAGLREGLGEIARSAERAARLTRQLLLFSRRQTMQVRSLDLVDVVGGVVKMLRRIIGEDVALEVGLGVRPIPLRADAGMVEQVVLNLAVNARDAMPQGGRLRIGLGEVELDLVEAEARGAPSAGRYAMLDVRDTGPGIPLELRARIFEPFFTTKEVGKGTGLGLATVLGVVQQHAGFIQVDDAPGGGAWFQIGFPMVEASTRATSAPLPQVGTPAASPASREAVLVVEDDPAVRGVVRAVLARNGFSVLVAADAAEAERIFTEHGAEIGTLLTDLVLPGSENGLQLAHRLRAGSPALRVICMSGYSDMPTWGGATVFTPDAHLQKPFGPGELLRAVRGASTLPTTA